MALRKKINGGTTSKGNDGATTGGTTSKWINNQPLAKGIAFVMWLMSQSCLSIFSLLTKSRRSP